MIIVQMGLRITIYDLATPPQLLEVPIDRPLRVGINRSREPREYVFAEEKVPFELCVLEPSGAQLLARKARFNVVPFPWHAVQKFPMRLHPGMTLRFAPVFRLHAISFDGETYTATPEYFEREFRTAGVLSLWDQPTLLEPDHALETLENSALEWIDACVDEWHSALYAWGLDASIRVPHVVLRSPEEMDASWLPLWFQNECPWNKSEEQLVLLHEQAYRTVVKERETSENLLVLLELGSALLDAGTTWAQMQWSEHAPSPWLSTLYAACMHALSEDREKPSLWHPLLALWKRGCWPMLAAGPTLQIYVPIRRNAVEPWINSTVLPKYKLPVNKALHDCFFGLTPPPASVLWPALDVVVVRGATGGL